MKTIGLIGGMSWESTVTYYQIINETIKEKLGGFHSAKILLYSVDFAEFEDHMTHSNWEQIAKDLTAAALNLERAGADFILICTNTMHKLVPEIEKQVKIPIIHIAQATAEELNQQGIHKAALLGTKYTMTQDFYRNKLEEAGIEVMIPDESEIEEVNDIIFNELCLGIVKEESRKRYSQIIDELKQNGAQGVIFGCTEIGLLIQQEDSSLPAFDTTQIHAKKAAALATN
ncbi:MAG: aspartate/glutamate racemase family protein [Clostridia bacterium]|nr:aspartate/glutamate racemase family protein [Clostridia bacterium]